jgi:glycosyltransferase involved in cell wall biosynthesis
MYLRHGAPAERTQVIGYGIELPSLPSAPLPATGPLRVVYVGSIGRLKGVHVLVEAFNALPPDAQLWIAGDLTRQPDYVQALRMRTRHPGVEYLGQLDRAATSQLMERADVVAVPSIWYEVMPLVIQEALARRRPVLTSRLGSMAGLIQDDVEGWLLPPDNPEAWAHALTTLAQNRSKLLQWQQNIRPVKSMAQHITEIESLYQRQLSLQS